MSLQITPGTASSEMSSLPLAQLCCSDALRCIFQMMELRDAVSAIQTCRSWHRAPSSGGVNMGMKCPFTNLKLKVTNEVAFFSLCRSPLRGFVHSLNLLDYGPIGLDLQEFE